MHEVECFEGATCKGVWERSVKFFRLESNQGPQLS